MNESLPHGLTKVADANLLQKGQDFFAKMNFLLSIMDLAADCCMESPDQRIHMESLQLTNVVLFVMYVC